MNQESPEKSNEDRHQPFEQWSGRETRVVLIHGYAGSPDQFRSLADRLQAEGCDCAALLMPGHGRDSRNFGHDWDQAWRQHVFSEVDRLTAGYLNVFLIGHSLGALLCLEYAAEFPVDGIVSISAPMGIRLDLFQIELSLEMLLTPKDRGRAVTKAYRAGFGVQMKGVLSPLSFIPPSFSLFRTIRRVRQELPHVHAPVLIIQSERDETISRKSADQIAGLLGRPGRILWLKQSRHAYRVPEEEKLVTQNICEMINFLARSREDQVSF